MLTPQFLKFCVVGLIGALVDAALLELFVHLGLTPFYARILSMLSALQLTYILHARFTFCRPRSLKGWSAFMLANSTGASVNYLSFFTAFSLLTTDSPLLQRQLALLIGTAAGLAFNYWANRRFVFAATEKK